MQQTCQMQEDESLHMSSRVSKPVGPEQADFDVCITS